MSWHTVHLADVAATPWRNGGGMTRELAAWPTNADWQWRMSVAEVGASGPFSRFDGVTRWFAVLQGAGVTLSVRTPGDSGEQGASEHRLTRSEPPLCFDGAAATQCSLIDGTTQDFNLMVRDAALPARMVRVHGPAQMLASAGKTVAVYAVDAGVDLHLNDEALYLPPGTLVWRTLKKAATVRLNGAHALWMELSL